MEEITQIEKKDSIKEFIEKAAPYIQKIIANWKKLLIINGIVAVVSSTFLLLFVKNYYDSTITIMPEYGDTGSMLGSLGGLAAFAGINVGEGIPTEIYQNLLSSEDVLKPVIYEKYKSMEFDKKVNLIEYFEIEIKTINEKAPLYLRERDKFLQMVEILNKSVITTSIERATNILTVTVRTEEPILSSEISNNLVKSLDEYVRIKRKSKAKEQRIYIDERVNQVKDSLANVENQLKNFREQNRIVGQSPQLLLEQGRLQRALEIQQTIFVELTKQLELVKLDEIKDTPIINIREQAGVPIKKAGPKRSIFILLILCLSVIISTVWVTHKEKIIEIFVLIKKSTTI